jgi:uncharacterized membrane protein YgaE (UPF0421/DUF939 family)
MTRSTLTTALQLSVRAALAAGLAVGLSWPFDFPYPIYALIASVLVTDLSPVRTRQLALRRLAGTILGAVVGATLGGFLPSRPWAVALGVLVAIFLAQLFRREIDFKLAGYTCGIVVLGYGQQPWMYALYRAIETTVGIGAAVAVSFVPKLLRIPEPEEEEG